MVMGRGLLTTSPILGSTARSCLICAWIAGGSEARSVKGCQIDGTVGAMMRKEMSETVVLRENRSTTWRTKYVTARQSLALEMVREVTSVLSFSSKVLTTSDRSAVVMYDAWTTDWLNLSETSPTCRLLLLELL